MHRETKAKTLLKRNFEHLWILRNFQEQLFYRTTLVAASKFKTEDLLQLTEIIRA